MRLDSIMNSTNVRQIAGFAVQRAYLSVASRVAPERAVEAAARLFTRPPRFPQTAREREVLASGERFEVRDGAMSLMAWRFGPRDRPAVLVSHGWGGRGAQLHALVRPLLEAGYQPVLFDHVGHGESGGVASTIVHFVRGLEAMVARLERDGVNVAALVGHSLGAAAVASWLNATGRELRAVLVAPPVSLVRASSHFAHRVGITERVRRGMQTRFEHTDGHPWADYELPRSVARVRAAALVIHDEGDRQVPFAAGRALAQAWPDARLLATRGLGHNRILRDAGVVRDAVDFLAGEVVFPHPRDASPAPLF